MRVVKQGDSVPSKDFRCRPQPLLPRRSTCRILRCRFYVGTEAATAIYRGRAGFTGEDQINFVVPAGVTGCYVPVAVKIGKIVSNFVTMPIAAAGNPVPIQHLLYCQWPTRAVRSPVILRSGETSSSETQRTQRIGPRRSLDVPMSSHFPMSLLCCQSVFASSTQLHWERNLSANL